MKSNVIRKLLPVMLMITLTAGIAPVSYAAAEEPAQQTEGVDEEPVQDSKMKMQMIRYRMGIIRLRKQKKSENQKSGNQI